jgi:hypothetical protein
MSPPSLPPTPEADRVSRLMSDLRASIESVKAPLAKLPGTPAPMTCWACRQPLAATR